MKRQLLPSVGQLTVGVTIPEWSGVLMLCNLEETPSSYMQAAFRAQKTRVLLLKMEKDIARKPHMYLISTRREHLSSSMNLQTICQKTQWMVEEQKVIESKTFVDY